MKNKKKVIAILCADIHMSHRPPVWRSAEPNWYEAMKRPLDEIKTMRETYGYCPVLCAGDIFDKWHSPPELINFAFDNLPIMISVAGQHDLPNHNIQEIYKSAYISLLNTHTIEDPYLEEEGDDEEEPDRYMSIIGFHFGRKLIPIQKQLLKSKKINIALVHKYVWAGKHKYPKAPKESRVETRTSKMINGKLYGYDVIVYGDNHKGFLTKVGKTTVFNCGTLMRRKSDEIDYKPQVGLLYNDGSVGPHYLDISQDKYLTVDEMKKAKSKEQIDLKDFAKELVKLSSSALDFVEAMKQFYRTNKVKKEVQKIIHTAMENGK